jgi:hypothetical protein
LFSTIEILASTIVGNIKMKTYTELLTFFDTLETLSFDFVDDTLPELAKLEEQVIMQFFNCIKELLKNVENKPEQHAECAEACILAIHRLFETRNHLFREEYDYFNAPYSRLNQLCLAVASFIAKHNEPISQILDCRIERSVTQYAGRSLKNDTEEGGIFRPALFVCDTDNHSSDKRCLVPLLDCMEYAKANPDFLFLKNAEGRFGDYKLHENTLKKIRTIAGEKSEAYYDALYECFVNDEDSLHFHLKKFNKAVRESSVEGSGSDKVANIKVLEKPIKIFVKIWLSLSEDDRLRAGNLKINDRDNRSLRSILNRVFLGCPDAGVELSHKEIEEAMTNFYCTEQLSNGINQFLINSETQATLRNIKTLRSNASKRLPNFHPLDQGFELALNTRTYQGPLNRIQIFDDASYKNFLLKFNDLFHFFIEQKSKEDWFIDFIKSIDEFVISPDSLSKKLSDDVLLKLINKYGQDFFSSFEKACTFISNLDGAIYVKTLDRLYKELSLKVTTVDQLSLVFKIILDSKQSIKVFYAMGSRIKNIILNAKDMSSILDLRYPLGPLGENEHLWLLNNLDGAVNAIIKNGSELADVLHALHGNLYLNLMNTLGSQLSSIIENSAQLESILSRITSPFYNGGRLSGSVLIEHLGIERFTNLIENPRQLENFLSSILKDEESSRFIIQSSSLVKNVIKNSKDLMEFIMSFQDFLASDWKNRITKRFFSLAKIDPDWLRKLYVELVEGAEFCKLASSHVEYLDLYELYSSFQAILTILADKRQQLSSLVSFQERAAFLLNAILNENAFRSYSNSGLLFYFETLACVRNKVCENLRGNWKMLLPSECFKEIDKEFNRFSSCTNPTLNACLNLLNVEASSSDLGLDLTSSVSQAPDDGGGRPRDEGADVERESKRRRFN